MPAIRRVLTYPFRVLRGFKYKADRYVAREGARSSFWASIYYAVFRGDYDREKTAFLAGRIAYGQSLKAPSGSMAMLRRNVHRLEKGLIMRPRRVPFAIDYLRETVEAFRTANGPSVDGGELAWATDVLTEYFRVNNGHPELEPFRTRFFDSLGTHSANGRRLIPYHRDAAASPAIDYDALFRLAHYRRSVRWFLQKPVPREIIDRAIVLAAQAPSACNRQPFEFRVFDDRELIRQIVDIPYGLAGYGHNVPAVAVVIGQQRHFFDERDRHLIYIDSSLAVMGFLFALEVQGVSSCCVNWPDVPDREMLMRKLLHLAADERPVMLVVFGYPDPEGMVPHSAKKNISLLRRYNFE